MNQNHIDINAHFCNYRHLNIIQDNTRSNTTQLMWCVNIYINSFYHASKVISITRLHITVGKRINQKPSGELIDFFSN